ncbi:MAG TPA: phosphatase PAP2 family protein [Acidimicrobiia bacterium]|jgi:undecaprenyl-diphosphatase|nr:phosphatase PAP2 family protein [Acidimicrobiia bacterium]
MPGIPPLASLLAGGLMEATSRPGGLARWCATKVDRARARLGLTWRGVCALAAAVVALVAAVTVLGGVAEDVIRHNGLASSDAAHLRLFTDHRPDLLVNAARVVTDLGGVFVLALIAVAAGLLLWYRGVPLVAAAAPAFALGVGATLADIGKQAVDRARPGVGFRLIAQGEPSFPSGHATDSAAVFLTLGLVLAVFVLRRPLARLATMTASGLLVAAIGVTRLVLGVHWPTDVLAGWALGATAALTVTIAATLVTRAVPPGSQPADGRARRAAHGLGQLLTAARSPAQREEKLRAA